VQTKLHIIYMGVIQVTRSNIGFFINILIHIYLSIKTNQTDIYLILLFTKYSFTAKKVNFYQTVIFL